MTKDEVKIIFAPKIKGNNLQLLDGCIVDIEKFAIRFANTPANYSDLLYANGYVDADNQGMGYKPFFDQCKEEGILI